MAPMKWKAGSGEEDDEGRWQRCLTYPKRRRLTPILAKNESTISLPVEGGGMRH